MTPRVRKNKYGRGLYARQAYARGDLIETSPVVLVARAQVPSEGRLTHYVFEWDRKHYALALGFGSLFNHDLTPNAYFRLDKKRDVIVFKALRPILRGEQLFVDYGYEPSAYL